MSIIGKLNFTFVNRASKIQTIKLYSDNPPTTLIPTNGWSARLVVCQSPSEDDPGIVFELNTDSGGITNDNNGTFTPIWDINDITKDWHDLFIYFETTDSGGIVKRQTQGKVKIL